MEDKDVQAMFESCTLLALNSIPKEMKDQLPLNVDKMVLRAVRPLMLRLLDSMKEDDRKAFGQSIAIQADLMGKYGERIAKFQLELATKMMEVFG